MLKVDFEYGKLKKYLKGMGKYFNTGIVDELNRIGSENIKKTKARLMFTKKSPDGSNFRALSPLYAKWKRRKHGSDDIGILNSKMAKSMGKTIKKKGKQTILKVGNRAVSERNGFPYPVVFHFGRKDGRQPSRPFVGMTDAEVEQYIKNFVKGLEKI